MTESRAVEVRSSSPVATAIAAAARPTVMDRFVEYFFPEKAGRRIQARVQLAVAQAHLGGYRGADQRGRLRGWHPWAGDAIADTHDALVEIRPRSRDLARNNPIGTGAIGSTVTSVVGTGLTVQPEIDRDFLGLSEEEANEWESRAKRLWRSWAETPECDITGEETFAGLQDLALRSTLESGDILEVKRWRRRAGSRWGTRIQLVEADRVSNPHWQMDTRRIAGGVEVDEDGRFTAFHVRDTHPGSLLPDALVDRWRRVAAYAPDGERAARLLYFQIRPGQRRGVPMLAPVIGTIKGIGRFADAELDAAVVSSFFTAFITTQPDEVGGGRGLPGGYADDDLSGDPSRAESGEVGLGPGAVVDLAPGEDVTFADPKRPNDAFRPFVESMLRFVGMALEIPYEVLVAQFDSSYSAARASLLRAWSLYRSRRAWLQRRFCQPTYEAVIAEAVSQGWLEAPGFFDDPLVRRAWCGSDWIGDAMPQIDPFREVRAAKMRVEEDFSYRGLEAREMKGEDWEDIIRHRDREEQERRRSGRVAPPEGLGEIDEQLEAEEAVA